MRADGEQCSLEFGEDNLILRHTNQPDLVVPLVALAGAEWEDAGRVSSGAADCDGRRHTPAGGA